MFAVDESYAPLFAGHIFMLPGRRSLATDAPPRLCNFEAFEPLHVNEPNCRKYSAKKVGGWVLNASAGQAAGTEGGAALLPGRGVTLSQKV